MAINEETSNGWNEYKRLVLSQLDGLTKKSDQIESKLDKLNNKVTILETKAVMYGAIAGFVITAIVQLVFVFVKTGG